jgi:hypothetical protein
MRMFISALALSLGLAGGGLAAGSYGVSTTVLDTEALDRATSEVLTTDGDSTALVNQLDRVMGIAIDTGVAANGDPAFAAQVEANRAKVRAAAITALNDPAMRAAVRRSVESLQSRLAETQAPTSEVQGTTIAVIAKQELAKQDPALAAQLPESLAPVTISAERSPAQTWVARLQDLTIKLALVALALVAIGILIAPNRAAVLRRVGRWALFVGGIPWMLFGLLPNYVLPHLGAAGGTLAGFLHAAGTDLVIPAAVLATGGLGLFLAAGATAKRNAMLKLMPQR